MDSVQALIVRTVRGVVCEVSNTAEWFQAPRRINVRIYLTNSALTGKIRQFVLFSITSLFVRGPPAFGQGLAARWIVIRPDLVCGMRRTEADRLSTVPRVSVTSQIRYFVNTAGTFVGSRRSNQKAKLSLEE